MGILRDIDSKKEEKKQGIAQEKMHLCVSSYSGSPAIAGAQQQILFMGKLAEPGDTAGAFFFLSFIIMVRHHKVKVRLCVRHPMPIQTLFLF